MTHSKKYNRLQLIIACCIVTWQLAAQPVRTLTVNELFTLGIENSLEIKASLINQQIAADREKTARSNRLPDINAGITGQYQGNPVWFGRAGEESTQPQVANWLHNYTIDVTQPLYRGGKIKQGMAKAALEREVASLSTGLSEAEMKLYLIGQYLDLLRLYKQKEVLAQNIEESEVRLHDIRQMRKEGMITQNDVIRSELQLTNYELSLRETSNNIIIVSQQLDIILGLDEEVLLQPDTAILKNVYPFASYTEYVEKAYDNYPELKIARMDVKLAQMNTRLSEADNLPWLSLRASNALGWPATTVAPVQDMFKNSWNLSLVLSYNLSSLYHNKHTVSAMRRTANLQQTRLEQLMQNIRASVKAAYIKHQEATDRIRALTTYVEQANENYRIVQNKYLNQLAILTDLLDASNVRLDAELQLTAAKATQIYTYYQLLRSSGNL